MSDDSGLTPASVPTPAPQHWIQRLSTVLFILFCFELGLFLLIYPWTDRWTDNYFSVVMPGVAFDRWRTLWNNSYVRGGVSGLGLVNIWIAVAEVFRMFTPNKH